MQVTTSVRVLHDHPVPVAMPGTRFGDNVENESVTVTWALVGPVPVALLLLTVSEKLPVVLLWARVEELAILESDRAGFPTTVTLAVAGVGVVPPPPVDVTVFVYGEPVAEAAVYATPMV